VGGKVALSSEKEKIEIVLDAHFFIVFFSLLRSPTP
jgi:hypothetical protein